MIEESASLLLTFAVEIDPAHVTEFHAAVNQLTRTAAGEPGVLEYRVGEDLEHPGRFVFLERYVDQAALDQHQATPACVAFLAGLPTWLVTRTEAAVQTVTTQAMILLEPDLSVDRSS